MLIEIIITSLIALLVALVSTFIYIVALVIDESEDPALLGIDSHEFSLTPVISPTELQPTDNQNIADNVSEYHDPCDCFETIESASATKTAMETLSENLRPPLTTYETGLSTDQTLPLCETVSSSADFPSTDTDSLSAQNSSTFWASEERERAAAADQQQQQPQSFDETFSTRSNIDDTNSTNSRSTWHSAPPVQKSHITSELGAASSKKLFDDFDAKEMQFGGTGLHWCKTKKSLGKLLRLGMPLELLNKRQETALHVAIRRRKLQVLIGLLCHGADVERRTESGETPLILACKINDIFACQLLLVFDADYDAKDSFGNTARHYAASICEKHKIHQKQQPNAAHLILAMLNAIGARRCDAEEHGPKGHGKCAAAAAEVEADEKCHLINSTGKARLSNSSSLVDDDDENIPSSCPATKRKQQQASFETCTDGCSPDGKYNGNSYNRWSNFKRESLYKRYMFADLIESLKNDLHNQNDNRCHHLKQQSSQSRLLCFDGGGLRGVIICQILIEMEKYLKRPMLSYFDWIGGTSVGAFMACALSLGTSLIDLRRICFDAKDEVFAGQKPYNAKFLERVLRRTCGSSTRMSDIERVQLAVTTVIADRDPCQLVLFRNYKSPSRLLELCGYKATVYNCMSGHAFVGRPMNETKILPTDYETSTMTGADPKELHKSVAQKNNLETLVSSSSSSFASADSTSNLKQSRSTGKSLVKPSIDVEQHKDKLSRAKSNGREDSLMIEHALDEHEDDPIVWQVVRASAAAPFFFKPYGAYLDGGLISNNPTLDMLSEFHSYHKVREFLARQNQLGRLQNVAPEIKGEIDSYLASRLSVVVSLGTGRGRVLSRRNMLDFGTIASGIAAVFSPVELARSIRAARELFKKLMQQSCNTDDHVLDRAQSWCASIKVPYFRINPPLANIFSIDDKRDEQLINAIWQTKLYMKEMSSQLQELSEILDGEQSNNSKSHLSEKAYLTL